jgi:hypothetical protein
MGGGTTRMALRSQKTMRISGSRTGTTTKLDCDATRQQLQQQQQRGRTTTRRRTPPKGGKHVRRTKARRRDWHLPRRYIAPPPRLTMATQRSCSWRRQWSQPQPHCTQLSRRGHCHCWEQGRQQSSQDCCCHNNAPVNNNDNELAWELVGTQQHEQHPGTSG